MNPKKPEPRREGGRNKTSKLTGVIDVTRSGRGFLLQESSDIPIPREDVGTALSGDVVEVTLRRGRDEMIGRVVRVIERKSSSFVGEIIKGPKGLMLHPDDQRVRFDFAIVGAEGAPTGHKAILDVTDWEGMPPSGKIRAVIGRAGEHETEMRAILAAKGFELGFPPDVMREAESLYKREVTTSDVVTSRRDFRTTLTFTIDPDTAKDFDDAISYRKLPDGNAEIGIHIADVTHFVRPGSALDREAENRATSVYLVDRTIPMLPPQLSEDLCSLRPDEDHLTFSAVFTFKPDGSVADRWFGKTIIRSQKRFTYEEADEVLKDTKHELHQELSEVWKIASRLRKKRFAEGAIMFGTDEVKPLVGADGKVTGFRRVPYTESHQLIEELMLLANREVATLVSTRLGKTNRLFVYRIHDVPNPEKIEELSVFLRAIGYQLELSGKKTRGKDINKLLKEAEGKPEEKLIQTATIRSMAKAVYTTKNVGHYGLAFDDYAHFTSPIRRYPDVMVHRTLETILSGKRITEHPNAIERKAVHASEREVAAAEAERASVKMKQVEFFAEHLIGAERDGVVSGVTEWGIYVQDQETGADGMIRLTTLTDDTYEYSPKKFAAIGTRTKRMIRLGDPVRYRVERADLTERTLDFSLLSSDKVP